MTAMGIGSVTCGKFAADFKKLPDTAENLYFTWAQGFMTGQNIFNVSSGSGARNLGATPVEEQEAFLRQYCNDHPLLFYWQGVLTLYLTLPVLRSK
jgi:hypothetical protein